MARFFIDRPVFAWVIALAIILAGLLALPSLPVAQYPNIAPPNVSINANYPGASARTAESATMIITNRFTAACILRTMVDCRRAGVRGGASRNTT